MKRCRDAAWRKEGDTLEGGGERLGDVRDGSRREGRELTNSTPGGGGGK